MTSVLKGNVLAGSGVIVHQVNCQGVMGAGLAKQIRSQHPSVYTKYKKACDNRSSQQLLGKIQVVQATREKIICNMFSQDRYGRGQRHTDYDAVRKCFRVLKKRMIKGGFEEWPIRIPFGYGCGLAGGHWPTVKQIIDEELEGMNYTYYKL